MGNMNQKMRNRILLSVLPIFVVVLVTLSVYNYSNMKRNLLNNYEESQKTTEAHIIDTITLIDAGYRMLEVRLEAELTDKVTSFLQEYTQADGNIKAVDLEALKKRYGNSYDFIIIDPETTIISATEPLAVHFNFKAFDPVLGEKINQIRLGNDVWFEQLRTNVGTGRLSKFAYIPTPDHEYLLEVGYSIDGFNDLIEELKPQSITDALIKINPLVEGIKIYDTYGYQIVDSGENFMPTAESIALVQKVQQEKTFELYEGNNIVRKYIYVELNSKRERTLANTDRIIEITYNKNIISDKLMRLTDISILVNLLILIGLILGVAYLSQKLTKPIEALKKVSEEIAKGNYLVQADISTQDEVGDLAQSFNTMISDINSSFSEIEKQKSALEDYSRNLEEKVSSRTQEIACRNAELEEKNKELERAWNEAREATESKSNFLAMMSHEIRTPINGIVGMSYLMLRTKLTSRQKDYISKIKSSADTLLEIINDVLDISKLEAGKTTLEKINFDFDEILDHVSNQVIFKAAEKDIELVFSCSPTIPRTLLGDPLRLKQVLNNLLNNAVKFTEAGEILVTVEMMDETAEKVRLLFTVKDSGVGIEPDKITRLFQAFQQADDSITRKYGGTGLGLSICKHFVNLMNGEIWVESDVGIGSAFHFTAEFAVGDEFGLTHAHDREELENLRVLVADDSEAARSVIETMLSPYFSDIQSVSSGAAALALIESCEKDNVFFDLVLIDWKMPGLDGLETAFKIKKSRNMHKVPAVLMLTAYDLDEAKKSEKSENVDAFLSKPVLRTALLQTIMSLVMPPAHLEHRKRHEEFHSLVVSDPAEEVKILLAEDNLINQQIVKELLEQDRFTVDVVGNGHLAVLAVAQTCYDLVLMDVQMPEMDGMEAARRIRATEGGKYIPIVAMTAHALEEDRIKSIEAGMNDFMSKPINEMRLYEMLMKWIPKKLSIAANYAERQDYDEGLIPALKSFHTKNPLANLHGNQALFIKLITEFYNEYHQADTLLEKLLDQEDAAGAAVLVHGIRGVSGNLGAMELFILAQAVEADLNKGIVRRDHGNYVTFINELTRVMKEIYDYNNAAVRETESTDSEMNKQGMGEFFEELKKLLREGSSEVELLIPALHQLLSHTEHAALSQLMVKQIENYDFDEALITIELVESST